MRHRGIIHRYLDPGTTLGEVLFGLIMVLTFTIGARLLTAEGELDPHELVVAAVGCNVAWGLIDAVLFVLGSLFQRSRHARFFRSLKSVRSEAEALAAVQDQFGLEDEALAVRPEDRARLYQAVLAASTHATTARVRVRRQDLWSAFFVFVLVVGTAVPAVIPFLLLDDADLALRVSNFVLVALLFLVGYWWAHYTDARPWLVATTVMILGLTMVLLAIPLGG
jgi:hypothetical protein